MASEIDRVIIKENTDLNGEEEKVCEKIPESNGDGLQESIPEVDSCVMDKIETVEDKIITIEDKIEIMEDNVEKNEGKVETNEDKIENNEVIIKTSEDKIENNEDKMKTIEDKIENNEDKIENNEEKMKTIEDKIGNNEDKVVTIENNVETSEVKIKVTEGKIENDKVDINENEEKICEKVIESNGPKKVAMCTSMDTETVRDAYDEVRADNTETQWAVFKFEGPRIVCSLKGTAFEEFREQFLENERAFGYIRLQTGDELSKRQKFLFVTWVGPGVSVIQRAKMSTDKSIIKNIISNFAVELQLESHSEFDLPFFIESLNKASGANYGTGVREI